jgi:quercetin dioxygenase-like cupin family protein
MMAPEVDNNKEFVLAGVVMKRLFSEEQTAGQFCLLETEATETQKRRSMSTPDDETLYIIEGELTAVLDGQSRRLR